MTTCSSAELGAREPGGELCWSWLCEAGGLGLALPVAALSISSLHTGRCRDQGHTSQCQGEPRPPHPAPNRYTDTLTSTILTILVLVCGTPVSSPARL